MLNKKFCPNCRSEEVMMVAGGITGTWMCKKCGFSGSIFPEKEILGGNMNSKNNEKMRKIGGRK